MADAVSPLQSLPVLIPAATLALAAALLVVIAVSDWRRRLIPNALVLVYAALFVPFAVYAPVDLAWWWHLLAAAVVFLFTFFCFTRRWLGGGDAKLIPAVALWLGPQATLPFLLMMGVGGSIVAGLVMVVAGKHRGAGRKLKLPYGLAIVFAALVMMWVQYGSPLLALANPEG